MKASKFLYWLLAILGFQMQSCAEEVETREEYGCPHIRFKEFKTNGIVQDKNGNKIQNAEVNLKINAIIESSDSISTSNDTFNIPVQTTVSDKNGFYEIVHNVKGDKYDYEIITNKEGYESDTIRKEVKSEKGGDENIKIDITLKKK